VYLSFASFSLSSELDVMIVMAPAAFASMRPVMETPPVPWKRTVWPGFSGTFPYSEFQAVVPVQTNAAS